MNKPGVNAKDGYDAFGLLCDVLEQWCAEQGLPYESADELALHSNVDERQKQWLHAFGRLWELTAGGA